MYLLLMNAFCEEAYYYFTEMHYEGIVLREACSLLIVVVFAGNREPDLNILF